MSPARVERLSRPRSWVGGILFDHGPLFLTWAFICFMFGVYRTGADDTDYLLTAGGLEKKVQHLAQKAKSGDPKECEELCKYIADYLYSNDSIKVKFVDLGLLSLMLELSESHASTRVRHLAIIAVQNASLAVDSQRLMVEKNYVPRLIALLEKRDTSDFHKVILATILCNLAGPLENRQALISAGAMGALHRMATARNRALRRHAFEKTLHRLARSFDAAAGESLQLASRQRELVAQYARDEHWFDRLPPAAAALTVPLLDLADQGLNSLFLHTGVGGLIWGSGVSLFHGEAPRAALRSGMRTALISTLIPFYFVSVLTNVYTGRRKHIDTPGGIVAFDSAALFSLYAIYPVLRHADRAYPLWLGGHVLGFAVFFARLRLSDADLLKKPVERVALEANLDLDAVPKAAAPRRRRSTAEAAANKSEETSSPSSNN